MYYQVGLLSWAVVTVLSAPTEVIPLEKQQPTVIPIISQSEELEPNGTYKFSYETGNGIKREEVSFDKIIPKVRGHSDGSDEGGESDYSDEIHVQQGSYSYTAPDGTVITVRYIADENGFQAFGDHLPRAPVPIQVSSSLADKSGRALKSVASAETASAPASAGISEPKPKLVKPVPETVQSVPEAPEVQQEPSEPALASLAVEARSSSDIESKSVEDVAAVPEQPAPVEAVEQSSSTIESDAVEAAKQSSTEALGEQSTTVSTEQLIVAPEKSTAAAEQSSAAAEQSTTAAEQSTAAAEQSTAAADQSTAGAEQSTAAVEQSTAAAEQSTAAVEQSTAAAEQSSVAAEQSTAADEEPSTVAIDQLVPIENAVNSATEAAEQPAPVTNIEESSTNAAVEQQSSTVSNDQELSTVAVEESPVPNAEAKAEPLEQSALVPESEEPASTQAALQSEDIASTIASV